MVKPLRYQGRRKIIILCIGVTALCGMLCVCFWGNVTSLAEDRHKAISDLKLIVVVTRRSGDVDFFNDILKADDIVFTYGAKVKLLQRITKPKTMFGRGSISAIEKELEKLDTLSVDYIQYNPEQWKDSHTPKEEIANLLDAVRRARVLADQHKAKLSFTTDYVLLEKYGQQIAPMVDMFGIQLQRYQRDGLERFRAEAARKVAIVRKGSKTVPIILQISLAPPKWEVRIMPDGTRKKVLLRDKNGRKVYEPLPTDTVLQQIQAIKDIADGIAFLYNEETRDELRKLVTQLRQ
jgi:hypothetical protein